MDENLTNDLSLGGNLWQVATVDERLVEILVQKYNLPYIVAKIMVLRGVGIEEVADFLNPKISNMMPDPYVLKDMQKASERIAEAIINKERISYVFVKEG